MSKVRTDNSHLAEKVQLRLDYLPKKKTVRVLSCYFGRNVVWNTVAALSPSRTIRVTGMDIVKGLPGAYLPGDNRKYLANMDLSGFDLIDLDAYGIPFEQLALVLDNHTARGKGAFITAIQTHHGALPHKLLLHLGFTKKMLQKAPTLFYTDGIGKLLRFMAEKGVKWVEGYNTPGKRKNYLFFKIPEK